MEVEKLNSLMIDVIKNIRSIRADNNILPHKTIKLQIYAINDNAIFLNSVINIISWLVKSEETKIVDQKPTDKNLAFSIVKKWVELYIDTSNAIDVEIEQTRLKKNISSTRDYIILLDKKLLNESFVNNAPEKLVRLEMQKKEQAKNKLLKLQEKLDTLK